MKIQHEQFSALSPEQRALLSLRLKNKRQQSAKRQIIARHEGQSIYPLSFEQQQLWFLQQLDPDSSAYHLKHIFVLKGRLDLPAFSRVFDELARRHEILRTSFISEEGRPLQIVAPAQAGMLEVVNLRDVPEAELEAHVSRLASAHAQQPFDLSRGPMLRATLLCASDEKHFLLLTLHHIVTDWWSFQILYRELSVLYEAYVQGRPSPLPELPIQFGDYAIWQRERLRGERLDALLDYWKKQLAGVAPLLALPTDRPRPSVQTFRGTRHYFTLPKRLTESFSALARAENVTLFTVFLAAFQTLLYRYTAQERLAVGTPSAHRSMGETEPLIGFLLNTLALSADFTRDPTFRELLDRLRPVVGGAHAHQELPFQKLVEELQPEREASFMPLVQVNFVFLTSHRPVRGALDMGGTDLNLSGVLVGEQSTDDFASPFDLSLALEDKPELIDAFFEYNTDLFDLPTIRRMEAHLRQLLDAIAANPDERISQLSIISADEERRLLCERNATDRDYAPLGCIHELFEQQAARTPDAVALMCGMERLSFGELDRRADRLARLLRARGVECETLVAVYVERSMEMVVALLAILKAGGAYVPLDTAYSKQRVELVMREARARLLLTERHLLASLTATEATNDWDAICLDSDWEQLAPEASARGASTNAREASTNESDELPRMSSSTSPNNLAYVIYTSGSTGTPKGVMGTHGGALNRFRWMWEKFPFEAGEVCSQKTALCFVDSVWEIFGGLLRGVPTVIIPDAAVRDPRQLAHALAAYSVTRLVLVPSLLRVLLDAEPDLRARLPKLRYCVSSGETLPADLSADFRERMPGCTLLNLYGSSEVSADVTCLDAYASPERARVPIGEPIANTQIYLLDAGLRLVGESIVGELYVGGANLARGYLHRPEWTAERFIPDPFSPEPGARLYRTGDLARYLEDGKLEYLGRIDTQVKIRGFRVELGEIESSLKQHEQVSEAVVVLKESATGDKRLVAYLVAAGEGKHDERDAFDEAALRAALREHLPDYMLPSAFVWLDALPVLPSGKVNRLALPAPSASPPRAPESLAAPVTSLQKELAEIWSEVLGISPIGLRDNFFELGGHSLLLTQVASRILTSFQTEVTLRALFDAPTLEAMAAVVEREQRGQTDATDAEAVSQLLSRLEQLSPEETRAMLEERGARAVLPPTDLPA